MDTAAFLRFILPSQGTYYAVWIKSEGQPVHYPLHSPEEVAAKVQQLSNDGNNAYHACASYAQESYKDDNGKTRWRTAENAAFVKSQWVDIDCNETYTQKQAVLDTRAFCRTTGLPSPSIVVNSGNGIHCYWVFDRDIRKDTWIKMAELFKAVCAHFQYAHTDTTRTADVASVLRPIGTVNDKRHKGKGVKPVTLLREPTTLVSPSAWVGILNKLKLEHSIPTVVTKAAKPRSESSDLNAALLGGMEYPESSASKIADKCAQIGNFRDFKGVGQDYQTWRDCIGVVKHCVEGDELIHEWSCEHTEYSAEACQDVIDKWNAGPTSCEKFKKDNNGVCAGCTEAVTSPISLGRLDPTPLRELVDVETGAVEHIPALPADIEERFRFVRGQGLQALWKQKDGTEEWETFLTTIPYIVSYYKDAVSDKWMFAIRTWMRSNTWSEAAVEAGVIFAGGAAMIKELGSYCMISAVYGRTQHLESYMKLWGERTRFHTAETEMHSYYGWKPDGSFVLGNVQYMPDGTTRFVPLDAVLRTYGVQLDVKGELPRYAELIDKLYNRPKHEAHQFTWLSGFGSVLLPLIHVGFMGGVLAAHASEGGEGKTTAQTLAFGIWGDTTRITGATAATEYALKLKAGLGRNLPMVIDEVTDWDSKRLATFAYDYNSGLPREQGLAGGGLRDNKNLGWTNFALLSSNKSLHGELIANYTNPSARLMRIWEYKFTAKPEDMLNRSEGERYVNELMRMRGVAGDAFLRYVVTHHDEVSEELIQADNYFSNALGFNNDARFWLKMAACILVAHRITLDLGIQRFDGGALKGWMKSSLRAMYRRVHDSRADMSGLFGDMVAELHSGFLVTNVEGDRRSKDGKAATIIGYPPRGTVTGRVIVTENRVMISMSAIKDWCKENNVPVDDIVDVSIARGWYKGRHKYSLGKGLANYALPQQQVVELDWAAFAERAHLVDVNAVSDAMGEASAAVQ
jgi:hypothetical protein